MVSRGTRWRYSYMYFIDVQCTCALKFIHCKLCWSCGFLVYLHISLSFDDLTLHVVLECHGSDARILHCNVHVKYPVLLINTYKHPVLIFHKLCVLQDVFSPYSCSWNREASQFWTGCLKWSTIIQNNSINISYLDYY